MMIAHIVAVAKNGVIGRDGDLPWNIPEDMQWFRSRTQQRVLIMGRKTFESVGHPLPNRLNIVITRQADYKPNVQNSPQAPLHIVPNLEEALAYGKQKVKEYNNEIFIIGGGEIYRESFKYVDTIFLTRVHLDFPGNVTYSTPPTKEFKITNEEHHMSNPTPFSILTYKRI